MKKQNAQNFVFQKENPDISEDAECETRENPDISKDPEREAPRTENPSIVTEMPRYPRRIRKKPDRYQVEHMDNGIIQFSIN